jgi:hypothetical protein
MSKQTLTLTINSHPQSIISDLRRAALLNDIPCLQEHTAKFRTFTWHGLHDGHIYDVLRQTSFPLTAPMKNALRPLKISRAVSFRASPPINKTIKLATYAMASNT